MHGWMGKYLHVNLTNREIKVKDLNMEDAEKYLGQRGLGTKMVIDLMPDPSIEPLSTENPLAFVTGPLTGLFGISNGRYEVVTKSPLTGTIGGSNSGGFWGPELKYAGYDAIIVQGKADKPVYLWVNDSEVELRSAEHLWGKDTFTTADTMKQETDEEAKILCIGPAGENLARIAAVMNDLYRAAARSGVGAVMGFKNLKGIAVRGTGEIKLANAPLYIKTVKECRQRMVEAGDTGGALTELGTPCLVQMVNESGATPVKNFSPASGYSPYAEKVTGEVLKETYLVKNKACFGCPISCGRVSRIPYGKYRTSQSEGPEYETTWAFSSNCGISDLQVVIKANYLCNAIGVDTISMGGTISCLMEMCEKGYVTEEEIGMPFGFGQADAMLKLIEDTGYRRGFGNKLAEGSYRLAASYGHPECSITIKRQEFPGYDPRAGQGVGLSYATSNRGCCHVRGNLTDPELTMHILDRTVTEGKAEFTKNVQDYISCLDSVGMCCFPMFTVLPGDVAKMLSLATGKEYTEETLLRCGERIWNMERLFNLKAGIKPEEDTLPERLLKEPLQTGSVKGKVSELYKMLPEYYQLRGWNEKGIPSTEKIKELELDNFAKIL